MLSKNGSPFAWLHDRTSMQYHKGVLRTGHFFLPFQTKLPGHLYTGFEKGNGEFFDVNFVSWKPNLIYGLYVLSL